MAMRAAAVAMAAVTWSLAPTCAESRIPSQRLLHRIEPSYVGSSEPTAAHPASSVCAFLTLRRSVASFVSVSDRLTTALSPPPVRPAAHCAFKLARGPFAVALEAAPPGGDEHPRPRTSVTTESVAEGLAGGSYRDVVVVLGAGASVSAGIPDFRTPGTGLYDKMAHHNLPFPEAVFDIDYYNENPAPFVELAREIWPGQEGGPRPTLAQSFVRLLETKGCLRRCYTQNIDGLERLAGVSVDKLVECHGHFRSARCASPHCRAPVAEAEICRDAMLRGEVPNCPVCGTGFIKPNVVFFGEELPSRFSDLIEHDMGACDLLIVMGTSLLVAPVAGIPEWVGKRVPRVLINRELVGDFVQEKIMVKNWGGGYERDIFLNGDCDDGVQDLCTLAGWKKEIEALHGAMFDQS